MLHFNTSVVHLKTSPSRSTSDQGGSILQVIYLSNIPNLPTFSLPFPGRSWLDGVIFGARKRVLSSIFMAYFKCCPLADLIWSDILLPEPIVIRPLSTDMIACTTNYCHVESDLAQWTLQLLAFGFGDKHINHPTVYFCFKATIRVSQISSFLSGGWKQDAHSISSAMMPCFNPLKNVWESQCKENYTQSQPSPEYEFAIIYNEFKMTLPKIDGLLDIP